MEETKELFESNTVFDDVFRTMLERIPEIMIPLINEDSLPLLEELSDIRSRLERTVGEEKGLIYAELISHIKKIDDHIFRNQPETRKRMEEITMGGQVYETLTDQAVKRGIFQSVMRLSDTGDYTEEEACAVLGAEYPAYLLYKEQLLATQSTK